MAERLGPRLGRGTPVVVTQELPDRVTALERRRNGGGGGGGGNALPAFYARRYHSTAWGPTATGTWYPIFFNVPDGGDDSLFVEAFPDFYYRCPAAGYYRVSVSWTVGASQNPTTFTIAIGRTSRERAFTVLTPSTMGLAQGTVAGTMNCAAGDSLRVWIGNATAGLSKAALDADFTGNWVEVVRLDGRPGGTPSLPALDQELPVRAAVTMEAPVNVRHPMFAGGAKGDAQANDTAALQSAITYARNVGRSSGPGMVFIPSGIYDIWNAALELGGVSGMNIFGEGDWASRIRQRTSGLPVFQQTATGVGGIWGTKIRDLYCYWTAQQTAQANPKAAAVRLVNNNWNGFWYGDYKIRTYQGAYGVWWGPPDGAADPRLAFWNNDIDLTANNVDGALLKNGSTVAVGQPINWAKVKYVGIGGFVPSGGEAALNLGAACDFQLTLDIEDWQDQILYSIGGGNIGIRGCHLERHRLVAAGAPAAIFTVSQGRLSIRDLDAAIRFMTTGGRWFVFPTQTITSLDNIEIVRDSEDAPGTGTLYLVAGNLPARTTLGVRAIDGTSTQDWQAFPTGVVSVEGAPPQVTALPAAAAELQGRQLYLKGTPPTADRLVVCRQSGGAYAWADQI